MNVKRNVALISAGIMFASTVPVFAKIISPLTVEATVIQNGSIPRGAQRVSMLRLRFQATCDADVPVSSVRLTHQGLGDSADLLSVYALQKNVRMSRGYRFSSSDNALVLRFSGFSIPKCGSEEVIVAVDFSGTAAAGGEHRLVLSSAQDVDAGPVNVTSTIRISPEIARTIGHTEGNIGVTYLALPKLARYGRNRVVARIRLEADSISDHEIRSIMLTNGGSASDAELQNLFLQASRGIQLTARVAKMNGDHVFLTFDPPLLLERNQEKVLELHADIFASRKRTMAFTVKEASDIVSFVKTGRSN